MTIPEDPTERKKWMMDVLRGYGEEFLIFEPEDQPNVFAEKERQVTETLKSGKVNPSTLQHWHYLEQTRSLLRDRYGIFERADLVIDCPLFLVRPRGLDQPQDFRKAFQLVIRRGMIGFICRRYRNCTREGCPFKKRRVLDIYDLIALLDGKSLPHAIRVVESYFGVELGDFPDKQAGDGGKKIPAAAENGGTNQQWIRYAVRKSDLERLFSIPMKGKGSGKRFVETALAVILRAPEAPYDGYNSDTGQAILLSRTFDWQNVLPEMGTASRLFLWVHWRQAEAGSKLRMTVQDVADALGVDKRTVQMHKKFLVDNGYLEVDERRNLWAANYAGHD